MTLFPKLKARQIELALGRRGIEDEDIRGDADRRPILVPMNPEVPANMGEAEPPEPRDPGQEQELEQVAREVVKARFRHGLLREHPVVVDQAPGVAQLDPS
jgi:hypothetical protein